MTNWVVEGGVGQVSNRGLFTPSQNGSGKIVGEFSGHRVEIPVEVKGLEVSYEPDFIHDVNPIITKLGCNSGTCHGSKDGREGFKLSLRGYDAIFDVRAFTDDLASRRVNVAAAEKSLMLLKATAAVPHEGGQITKHGSKSYRIIRDWIASGAELNLGVPRVESIELFPKNPVVQEVGSTQQIRVVATYADGVSRGVTREAVVTVATEKLPSTTKAP